MVDSWIHEYRPEDVIQALSPFVSGDRRSALERVLSFRIASVTAVLENLHDPHNGAAALRSLEGLGLCDLSVVEEAAPFRFSSRVTQGCEKWIVVHRHQSFQACAQALRAQGFVLWAAVPGARCAVEDIDVSRKVALVFGNEHAGLTGTTRADCDASFGIPMHGFTGSFNLSVSVALALHACARRRRAVLAPATSDLSPQARDQLAARFYALSLEDRAAHGIVQRFVATGTHGSVGEPTREC